MSKVIYLLGAGASCGNILARQKAKLEDDEDLIFEGIPIVSEIAPRLLEFRKAIENATIDKELYVFKNTYKTYGSDVNSTKMRLVDDINFVYNGAKDHATIDTFARKLYLTEREEDFKRLKDVLCTFFVWQQVCSKPDQRYDTFFANVLSPKRLSLPKEISIISWNYDSQFEIAYKNYNPDAKFPIKEKNYKGKWPSTDDYGQVFKVNGSATFGNFSAVLNIMQDSDIPKDIQLIIFYSDLTSDTSSLEFNFSSHLSFAWEESKQMSNMMEYIKLAVSDAESLVVIGYSFPFFNRDIDRAIFQMMPDLNTIYIQDPNAPSVETSLNTVLPDDFLVTIEHINDCSQFYLPKEL